MLIIPLHIRQISSEIMNGEFRGRGNFLKSVGTQPLFSGKITTANQITTALILAEAIFSFSQQKI